MHLEQVHWADVPLLWPAVKDWIAQALEHGAGYWPEDIRKALMCREMTLWLVKDGEGSLHACTVTQLWSQPRVKVCDLLLIGGRGLEHWAHLIGVLMEYAKAHGAQELRGLGRIGWKPTARQFGLEVLHVTYRARL